MLTFTAIAVAVGALALRDDAPRTPAPIRRPAPRPVDTLPADAPIGPTSAAAAFAGDSVCGPCHARETAAWLGSHHQLAMQPASEATVLGDFGRARGVRA